MCMCVRASGGTNEVGLVLYGPVETLVPRFPSAGWNATVSVGS